MRTLKLTVVAVMLALTGAVYAAGSMQQPAAAQDAKAKT